jgi:hypothetical protein
MGEENTAPKLFLVGDSRPAPRRVRVKEIAPYVGGRSDKMMPFFRAHEKAQEMGGNLISLRTAVRLLHALSNPGAYEGGWKNVAQNEGSALDGKCASFSTPGLEIFLEGVSVEDIGPVFSIPGPFWTGGLLVTAAGRRFKEELVAGPYLWCGERDTFQVPQEMRGKREAVGKSLIYEPGTFTFERGEGGTAYSPTGKARPLWVPDEGPFGSSVLDRATDLKGEEVAPEITVFMNMRTRVEVVSPLLCKIAPTDRMSIQLSAIVPPTEPLGALVELPWND